ncbi:response regulator [Sulfitobacter sp. S190]|uniref:response regulator n=1 Tax=Sulfitobacter sp. S190 TaxID=2867022 RepID=UPI0021A339DA|nr:response regulator transcription factor [Sulfitobacter sp. S190]UWR21835.1 response regulator transcription factor [Sulfitobacter sp. S190]
MSDPHILVVDDDAKIRTLLRNVLEGEGFAVIEAASMAEILQALEDHSISLITLDINLGSENGIDLARQLRAQSAVPIIMVTGKDDVIDRVVGLEVGADDYITKPFHVREVLARIRSVLRRTQVVQEAQTNEQSDQEACNGPTTSKRYCFDGLTVIPAEFQLIDRTGTDCALTSGDFKLLDVFLTRPKRVLTRDQLMDLTGGIEWSPLDRTVDNQVARLRKKIERDPSEPKLIKTVRGMGYTFACNVQVLEPSEEPAKSA